MKKLFLLMVAALLTTSAGGCRNGCCGWRHSWFNRDTCYTCPSTCDPCCNPCGSACGGGEVIYGSTLPGPVTVQTTP
jgi:hypothetical protein